MGGVSVGNEIANVGKISTKPAKKHAAFKRDAPDLPSDFESPNDPTQLFADEELVTIQEMRLQDLDQANLKAATF